MIKNEEIIRYDQRDALPYRSQLKPGTPEYEAYYRMHPEFEEKDKQVRVHYDESLAGQVRLEKSPGERLANAWVHGVKHSTGFLLRSAVDGPVNRERLDMNPHEITLKVKACQSIWGRGSPGSAGSIRRGSIPTGPRAGPSSGGSRSNSNTDTPLSSGSPIPGISG